MKFFNPIKGMFKNMVDPVYSLLEAIEGMVTSSIEGRLAMDPQDIIDYAESATDSAEMFLDSDPSCPLAKNEVSALIFYTMDFSVREQSPYYVMNAALRNEDRNQLKPFVKYLWLFMNAFKKVISLATMSEFYFSNTYHINNFNHYFFSVSSFLFYSFSLFVSVVSAIRSQNTLSRSEGRSHQSRRLHSRQEDRVGRCVLSLRRYL